MYPHLSGEEAEIGLVLFDSNAEVGPLQPLGIWGETRTPGLFFFVFLFFLPCAQQATVMEGLFNPSLCFSIWKKASSQERWQTFALGMAGGWLQLCH